MVTVAGYTLYLLLDHNVSWLVAFPAAVLASMGSALLLERLAYRRLRGAQPLTLLMTSFAISVSLQGMFLLVFGPRPKGLLLPSFVDTSFSLGSVRLQALDIVTLLTTLAIVVSLTVFLRRTVLGLALRSAADDFQTTRLMGVRANAVIVGAFLISGALAGIAGLFFFAAVPNVVPTSGFEPMLKGFIACVIGGLGSLPAAVIGGFLLAFVEVGCEALLSSTLNPYLDAIVFGVAIAILRWRPGGVFGLRLAEDVRV
jgi:branched-chain amino acid transport system permease protein